MFKSVVSLLFLFSPFVAGFFIHKERKKLFALLGLFLIVMTAFIIWLSHAATEYLPANLQTLDQALLQTIIKEHVARDHTFIFGTYQLLWIGLWSACLIYDVIGILKRRKEASTI